MKLFFRFLPIAVLIGAVSAPCFSATITGSVKGPEGSPFRGAFVQAQNVKTRISVLVLSNDQGHYRVENLPAGEYRMQIRAIGYSANPQTGVKLADAQNASFDFALRKTPARWSDLNVYQGKKLLPESPSKAAFFRECSICHSFQTRIAAVSRDEEGYRDRIRFMQNTMSLGSRFTDKDGDEMAVYFASLFGPDATAPKSPENIPGYSETLRPVSSDALGITYVEYEMPAESWMPFSAAPGKDGSMWIPNFGNANRITRLDPKTGETESFKVPFERTAKIHSAAEAPDGSVWATEQGSNRIARWDPVTRKITEYQDFYPRENGTDRGRKHTLIFDLEGNVWSTGTPLSRFNIKTKEFDHFKEVNVAYGITRDKDGNIWATSSRQDLIARVDWKTLKLKTWDIPKDSHARRIAIDPEGIVWVGLYNRGELLRFDPKTETSRQYPLPGPKATPYGLGVDSKGNVWYSSFEQDTLGRLDPKTGKITEYPFPHSENTIREFFLDAGGKLWFGTPSNNRVGYIVMPGDEPRKISRK
ncbi:MAG TPA: carboxypeptidase regulatory-like domain-containing protein [Terriglobales bacterium]|nr:carboxypeptidase regulatory-like domain-containing protein [Terriglobales bacterium]